MNPLVDGLSLLPWILLGVSAGAMVGAIPGLTGAMVIALTVPLTFSMPESSALALLVSLYTGSVGGGLVTAALLKIPGTPASMITILDAYPLTQRGEGRKALRLGIVASCVGGLLSGVALLFLSRPMAEWSVRLSAFDLFSLTLMALVFIAAVAEPGRRGLALGILSGCLGCLASLPGMHPATGELRYTFGFPLLNGGLNLLPVLIGLFAFGQAFRDCLISPSFPEARNGGASVSTSDQGRLGWSMWRKLTGTLLRSSLIGTVIGILPGIGANVGSTVSYGVARQLSRHPEKFGKGSEEGLVASETANNATVGGALIPLVSLGIPGSVVDAILLGAFVIHGLQPGPLLFANYPETVQSLIRAYLISNLVLLLVMLFLAKWFLKVAQVPRAYLGPVILLLCIVGSYCVHNRLFDVLVMAAFGLLGLLFHRWRIPPAPFVIGFVLTPILEENLGAGLMISGGSYAPLLTSPFSLTCLVLSLLIAAGSFRASEKFTRSRSV